jgi:hypothetical protein
MPGTTTKSSERLIDFLSPPENSRKPESKSSLDTWKWKED